MAAALRQRRIQPEDRRHLPSQSGRIQRPEQRQLRPDRRPEPVARYGRLEGPFSTSTRAGRSAGTFSTRPTRISRRPTGSKGFDDFVQRSEIYLTGLNDRTISIFAA